jgi:hypothetical protein
MSDSTSCSFDDLALILRYGNHLIVIQLEILPHILHQVSLVEL